MKKKLSGFWPMIHLWLPIYVLCIDVRIFFLTKVNIKFFMVGPYLMCTKNVSDLFYFLGIKLFWSEILIWEVNKTNISLNLCKLPPIFFLWTQKLIGFLEIHRNFLGKKSPYSSQFDSRFLPNDFICILAIFHTTWTNQEGWKIW